MYIFVAPPERPAAATTKPFRITTSSNTCSSEPVTLIVVHPDNQYMTLLSIAMSDADLDCLIYEAVSAREERSQQKAATLARLQSELNITTDPDVSA